jgi:uncharacterized membrane protein YbhN (UPF0104 family)/tRNA A-37 threonylcarbamoyl transferase component Bud32
VAASSTTADAPGAGRFDWRSLGLLTAHESGRRNRRTIDGALLGAGAIFTGLTAAIARSAGTQDQHVANALVTVLGWADAVWRTVFVAALVLALVVIVDVLVRRRWLIVRDIAVVLALEAGVGVLLARIAEDNWEPFAGHLLSRWGFPELRIAWTTAVLMVAGPELVRPIRRFAFALVPLAALGAVVVGAALPSEALGALAFGLGAAAVVRLAFGTAAGVPPSARVQSQLAALGLHTADLRPAPQQRIGYAEYIGLESTGRPLKVRVLGRDAQDTQRLARRWRALAYRDPRRSVAVGRLEQVEHEALMTMMAGHAGVRVPEVVTATLGFEGDALIVLRQPVDPPLEDWEPDKVSDELLEEIWKQAAQLHAAGMSHGRLNLRNVEVADGKPVLLDLSVATLGAPQTAIDIDVAELLVACTVLVGPERALHAACRGAGAEAVAQALPYMERAALTPHVRDLARHHEVALKKLREDAAAETHTKLPDIAPLRRVRPRDFLFTGLVVVAAYLLITKLAKIGFGTIAHELGQANVAWVAVAVILAMLTVIPQAIQLRGAVETPLPLLPCAVLQFADKFLNLTVPGSAGSIALTTRFLQRLGTPTGEALASSAIDGLSESLLQVVLVLILLPIVHYHLQTSGLSNAVPSGRFVAIIAIVLVAIVVVALAIPPVRKRVVPEVRGAFHTLWRIARTPRKLGELFGGALAKNILYAMTLGAAALAYGVHLSLGQLILVNVISSTLASLVPVPGGIGAAEAALAGGLVAMGVNESIAFAIALTHRLCTYYLPPIWGYFSLEWLRRKGHV